MSSRHAIRQHYAKFPGYRDKAVSWEAECDSDALTDVILACWRDCRKPGDTFTVWLDDDRQVRGHVEERRRGQYHIDHYSFINLYVKTRKVRPNEDNTDLSLINHELAKFGCRPISSTYDVPDWRVMERVKWTKIEPKKKEDNAA